MYTINIYIYVFIYMCVSYPTLRTSIFLAVTFSSKPLLASFQSLHFQAPI